MRKAEKIPRCAAVRSSEKKKWAEAEKNDKCYGQAGERWRVMIPVVLTDSILWVLVLFGSCCSNVISLEKYLLYNKSTYLLTFVQFVVVSLESFINLVSQGNGVGRFKIPLKRHAGNVMLYFTTSTLNNLAFNYNVKVSTHVIVRSLGTVVNMTVGFLFFKKRYNYKKVLSNILLVLGVILVTVSKDAALQDQWQLDSAASNSMGILLLLLSMVTGSFLGLHTEVVYQKYGNHWQENLFVIHVLSLPMFLVGYKQLYAEYSQVKWNLRLVQMMVLNVMSQIVCVKSVNKLATKMTSLSVNIILLLRKFLSLIISLLVINRDSFSTLEVCGCGMVFVGLLFYSFA